jgi:7-keto-8-aminopelargonate synthetase-like enzyme
MTKYDFYLQSLEKKLQQKNYQHLKSILPEENQLLEAKKPLLNFISYDFLNISEHPFVKKNAIKYVLKWGAGSAPSQLISSHLLCQQQIEDHLAKLFAKETCLFLQPNQQIHATLLGTLLLKPTLVFIDESCHVNLFRSIPPTSKIIRFDHNKPEHLEKLLIEHKTQSLPKWVIFESLYSNEGDLAKIKEILEVSAKHDCLTYLDESYAFSVLGHHGLGLGAMKKDIDCIVGFFQRGSGSHAAFLVTKTLLKNFLLQFNPEISPYQLLPPATLGAIEAYLTLIPDMHSERQKIMHQSRFLRSELLERGFSLKKSASHLIIIHFDDEENFQSFVAHLVEENILAFIQKQDMTIKLLITSTHSKEILIDFLNRLKSWQKPLAYSQF